MKGSRPAPAGPGMLRLFPDPPSASPESFDLAVTWVRDPAPQGSKNPVPIWRNRGNGPEGRRILGYSPDGAKELAGIEVVESSKFVQPWRALLAAEAARRMRSAPPMDGPICAVMVFTLHRPGSHYRTGRNAGRLRDTAPAAHTVYPDLSKLARAAEDALTDGRMIADDARIWRYDHLAKVYPGTPAPAGWPHPVYALQRPGVFIHLERGT